MSEHAKSDRPLHEVGPSSYHRCLALKRLVCVFSLDGEHLAMTSQDESVQVWPWQPESLIRLAPASAAT